MLSVKQGGFKYHFWVFRMTRLGIEPQSPEPLVNTLQLGQLPQNKNYEGIREWSAVK